MIERVSRAQVYTLYTYVLRLYAHSKPHLPTICACAKILNTCRTPPFIILDTPLHPSIVVYMYVRCPSMFQVVSIYFFSASFQVQRSQSSIVSVSNSNNVCCVSVTDHTSYISSPRLCLLPLVVTSCVFT